MIKKQFDIVKRVQIMFLAVSHRASLLAWTPHMRSRRGPGRVADRRTHTPPTGGKHDDNNTSFGHLRWYQRPVRRKKWARSRSRRRPAPFCGWTYLESASRKLAGLASSSENNKRFIFPQQVRHFGFPLVLGECIMGRAAAAFTFFFQTFENVGRTFNHCAQARPPIHRLITRICVCFHSFVVLRVRQYQGFPD